MCAHTDTLLTILVRCGLVKWNFLWSGALNSSVALWPTEWNRPWEWCFGSGWSDFSSGTHYAIPTASQPHCHLFTLLLYICSFSLPLVTPRGCRMRITVESVNVISDYEVKESLCPVSIFKRGSVSNVFCFSEFQINVGLCMSLAVTERACNFSWRNFRWNTKGSHDES